MDHLKKTNIKKHVINFKTDNEPKMKFVDFGAFQIKMQIHMRKYSFKCFLGHSILPPVYYSLVHGTCVLLLSTHSDY